MKFNQQTNNVNETFRKAVAPRLLLHKWLRYQMRRTTAAYLPAYRRSTSRKPSTIVAAEALLLALRWRCLPFHYLRYGLYDQKHSIRQILSYLPETVFYYRLLPAVNRDTVLLDDKLSCKRILTSAGIHQPALLLSGDAHKCLDASGKMAPTSSRAQVSQALGSKSAVVIKPARFSSGGEGVRVLRHEAGLLYDSSTPFSLPRYGAVWGEWLIEEYIEQHPDLAALHSASLNTFRVITTWHPRAGARVVACVLKLGTGTGLVDNAHSGGLYARVDRETGRLDGPGFDENFTQHSRHPGSGVVLDGYQLGMIGEVAALAEHCAALFPQTALIGWDIAVGANGPLIVEGNSSPGLTNIQRTHGGVALTLGRSLHHAYRSESR
ncbi:sugar-transfer associated ATP-grasp domain-containing protein [Streptomyces sp. H10-C2]|uniref:sugar-transfer associated ATP-grasp domain-containing protein n=1 Tax=unclassified Streptomyces TaxID=2593676 RepID=UPI0024BA527C|nr:MULTISPECIES: sugar-transfer associated ATP-grasp domain-containing protein [unclassified Streptomyces]MDJ0346291.1 sugar-transfer associated ATP-grasp domain-containing protein [Streptomyces sp. PH10-H1]MDJ0374900.1 sugar-transfer associated ATP-grasp domain-containing protein [Streptomyces sp. H10-C2]